MAQPRAKIFYSRPGIQGPLYIVTSMSSPPWEVLEMKRGEPTSTGDPVYYREFENVSEGQHQYKIRIGDHHWVVDDQAETGAQLQA